VNWIQDIFPEAAEALGMPRIPLLRRARDWSLHRARTNIVLSETMAARVPHAIVVHNWADASLRPMPRDSAAPFTVAYSGNLGRAHEFDTILRAMQQLPGVRFAITGGGAQLARVRAAAPSNVAFQPYVPREELGRSLSDADVHLVSLLPPLEGLIVPSKIYGVLAVGRPIVFIGARDGIGRMLEENGCGVVVEPGDVDGLVNALVALQTNRARALEMGARGRALYESRFAPEIAFEAWERIL
jgi:glycosyltransferase involved in cell wall biosynthesis